MIYTNYKIGQNFTPDEIISKSNSIKGVLEPFSSNENLRRSNRKEPFISKAFFILKIDDTNKKTQIIQECKTAWIFRKY